jgi:WD40 repeat protein
MGPSSGCGDDGAIMLWDFNTGEHLKLCGVTDPTSVSISRGSGA